jgi:hypothetical protein
MNQHYFDVPFAFAGDVTAIPDPLQTGGTVSFTEGWNYNYQRDLATDPAALPIDRSTTNWLLLQITTALQALQAETVPEFILASQNGGVAIAYGPQAEVLWSASGNAPFAKYVNISGAANSNTPSASDPLGTTTGWQVACDPIATASQASTGTNNASIMTPLLVAQQTALRALLAGSSSQVFNVGPATSLSHAPEAGQVQLGTLNYAGAAGGTANVLTATLAPAPTAYAAPLEVIVQVSTTNTGATTLNVNGLGAIAVVGSAHAALQGNELVAGGLACFVYDASLSKFVLAWSTGGSEQVGNATQSQQALTAGQAIRRFLGYQIISASGTYTPGTYTIGGVTYTATAARVRMVGGGGAGGSIPATSGGQAAVASGAQGGAYAEFWILTGLVATSVTIGAGGTSGAGGNNPGNAGGTTSFGTLCSCPGGAGGLGSGAGAAPFIAIASGTATAPSGTATRLISLPGQYSTIGIAPNTTSVQAGAGGGSPFGAGGVGAGGGNGSGGTNYGCGGGGAGAGASSGSTFIGGPGNQGLIIVEEYA